MTRRCSQPTGPPHVSRARGFGCRLSFEETPTPRARRTFTREFKVQAVKLVTEQGCSFAEAARQLGVRDHQIRTWKKLLDAELSGAASGDGTPAAIDAEMRRLRAENKRLQLEHDIRKKVAAFFARGYR